MHPAFLARWKAAQLEDAEVRTLHGGGGCGPGHHGRALRAARWGGGGGGPGGGGFGIRRPLRYLAHKLELDEDQVGELAGILDDVKTERAQAAVDHRRSLKAFAEAIGNAEFGKERADEARTARLATEEKLQGVIVDALERLHAILDADQRNTLAYLLRSGQLTL